MRYVVAAVVGIAVVVALALFLRPRPRAFPLLAIAAVPFRLPISADGRTVNLLIPLYVVVAAGTLAYLSDLRKRTYKPILLDWLLLATVLLYALQASYS